MSDGEIVNNNRLTIDNGDDIFVEGDEDIIYDPLIKLLVDDPIITDWGQWEWEPQLDITAYELALALPVLLYESWDAGRLVQDMPENVRRHFKRA